MFWKLLVLYHLLRSASCEPLVLCLREQKTHFHKGTWLRLEQQRVAFASEAVGPEFDSGPGHT